MAELAGVLAAGSRQRRTRRGRTGCPTALLAPGLLWLVVFFVAADGHPGLAVAAGGVGRGRLHLHRQRRRSTPTRCRSTGRSCCARSCTPRTATVAALVLGYPLAYYIAQKAGRWKNVMLVLVIAPFFTSFLIRTLAWRTILVRHRPGHRRRAVAAHHRPAPARCGLTDNDSLLSSQFAVICGLTYNFLPFMILPLYASLERLDPRLIEAAGDLYASPFQAFRKVTWPAVAARCRRRHAADVHPGGR